MRVKVYYKKTCSPEIWITVQNSASPEDNCKTPKSQFPCVSSSRYEIHGFHFRSSPSWLTEVVGTCDGYDYAGKYEGGIIVPQPS